MPRASPKVHPAYISGYLSLLEQVTLSKLRSREVQAQPAHLLSEQTVYPIKVSYAQRRQVIRDEADGTNFPSASAFSAF